MSHKDKMNSQRIVTTVLILKSKLNKHIAAVMIGIIIDEKMTATQICVHLCMKYKD